MTPYDHLLESALHLDDAQLAAFGDAILAEVNRRGAAEKRTESPPFDGNYLDTLAEAEEFARHLVPHCEWIPGLDHPGIVAWTHPVFGVVRATPDHEEVCQVPVEFELPDQSIIDMLAFPLPPAVTMAARAQAYQLVISPYLDAAKARATAMRRDSQPEQCECGRVASECSYLEDPESGHHDRS
jgi:hypothetical protein